MEVRGRPGRWTWAEFARLPSQGGTRHEVIAGELVVTPAPSLGHQRISTALSALLHGFVRAHELGEVFHGPVDVLFGEGDYLEPDIVFVRSGHRAYLTDRGIEGPPDLVVEIVSPSTAARDRSIKLERYRHFGVPEYWVVDPDARSIEVCRFADGARKPQVFGPADPFRWCPGPGDVSFEVIVGDVIPDE